MLLPPSGLLVIASLTIGNELSLRLALFVSQVMGDKPYNTGNIVNGFIRRKKMEKKKKKEKQC